MPTDFRPWDELDINLFLFQSDKLSVVPHLLLAPIGTAVKPAEHEFVCRRSPMLSAESWVENKNDWL